MQIREINIEGFGIFSAKRVTGLAAGLNVIYGENEAGKTTLIEFIRRILFGAPRKLKGVNLYPPLNGGRHGGSLKCLLASSEEVLVARALSEKNEVDITPAIGGLKGQAALDVVLGHASVNIFKNIFAFTLDELQSFDSLDDDKIKNRIYGAELGLGDVSLKQVEDSLDKQAEENFLPRGKKTKTNLLLSAIKNLEKEILTIQEQTGEYDRLTQQLESSEKVQGSRQEKIEVLQAEKRNLETRRDLYKVVREMRAIEMELRELGEVREFPPSGMKTFEGLIGEIKTLKCRLDEEESRVNEMRIEQDSLAINQDLLSHETDITQLKQSIQSIDISLKDSEKLQRETSALAKEIEANLKEIGGSWSKEKVLNFTEFNRAKTEQIEIFSRDFENCRQEEAKAKDRLDNHQEQNAKALSEGWNLPLWLKTIACGLFGLGVAGLVWARLDTNTPLLIGAVVMIFSGGFLFWKLVKQKKDFVREDHHEKSLLEKLRQAEAGHGQKKTEWRTWLNSMAFDETLEPLKAQEFGNAIKEIKVKLHEKRELDARIKDMRDSLADTAHRIAKIKSSLPENSLPGSIPTDIKIVSDLFAQAKENLSHKNQSEILIRQQVYTIEKLNSQLKEARLSLEQELKTVEAGDENDYRVKFDTFEKRNLLTEQAEQKKGVIEMRVGSGPRYQQFLGEIDCQSPDEILDALAEISSQLQALQKEKDNAYETIGKTGEQLEQIASNDEMLVKQGELEIKKQKLRDCVKQWATAKIALVMLESAKRQYEKTRQPGVLKSAESVFAQITGGKYPRIVKPLDEDEVFIQNEQGAKIKVSETSRGTREQLYLSMRFGLIKEYESRSEPLPIVMDDVLVNFDDSRKAQVIAALKHFSAHRQIIVLTCHKASLEDYLSAGATRIEI